MSRTATGRKGIRNEATELGFAYQFDKRLGRAKWRCECSVCGKAAIKGWPFDTAPVTMQNNMKRAGWTYLGRGKWRCNDHPRLRVVDHPVDWKSGTCVTTQMEVVDANAKPLPEVMPLNVADFFTEPVPTLPPAQVVDSPKQLAPVEDPTPMLDTTSKHRKPRVHMSGPETINVGKLLDEHFHLIPGTNYYAWDKDWDAARVAREAAIGGNPLTKEHVRYLAKQLGKQEKPATPQTLADRVAKLEADQASLIEIVTAMSLFLEQMHPEQIKVFRQSLKQSI